MKLTNKIRRTVAMCGIGWSVFDLFPGRHFTWLDGIVTALGITIYVMSLFIKENNAIR